MHLRLTQCFHLTKHFPVAVSKNKVGRINNVYLFHVGLTRIHLNSYASIVVKHERWECVAVPSVVGSSHHG